MAPNLRSPLWQRKRSFRAKPTGEYSRAINREHNNAFFYQMSSENSTPLDFISLTTPLPHPSGFQNDGYSTSFRWPPPLPHPSGLQNDGYSPSQINRKAFRFVCRGEPHPGTAGFFIDILDGL